jgi:membrane protein YqaA with SNARE-associated domain
VIGDKVFIPITYHRSLITFLKANDVQKISLPLTARQRQTAARVIALLLVVAISVYIFSIRDQAEELARYGYPGIFLLSFLSNATVLLPAPGVLFVFAMGAVFNPVGVSLAAGAGAALGELSGYLAGFTGQAVVGKYHAYLRLRDWMERNPHLISITIVFLAFIPNPLFDLAGIVAGTLKFPVQRFLFWCFIGKTLKMLLFAYAGASSLNWLFSP